MTDEQIQQEEEKMLEKMTMAKDTETTFTPRHWKNGIRIEIKIPMMDYLRYQDSDKEEWTEVTDLVHETQILVQRADCGADCFCDAIYKLKD